MYSAFGGHGGKGETQAILALKPETVQMDYLSGNEAWWNKNANEADEITAINEMNRNIECIIKKIH